MLLVVDTLAAAFISFKNPNQHVMMYTLKGSSRINVFKASLNTGHMDAMLYLSAADNRADRVGKLVNFVGSTPG